MITLIVDFMETPEQRFIRENMTIRELGNVLTDLSNRYVLVFDTVRKITESVGCTIYLTAVSSR